MFIAWLRRADPEWFRDFGASAPALLCFFHNRIGLSITIGVFVPLVKALRRICYCYGERRKQNALREEML